MVDNRIYEMFREIGEDLYTAQMVSSHGGNLSIRLGDRVIIKRRGAMLGRLKPHDLIETRLDKNDSGVALASTELIVHRAIYQNTPALAICHCHPRTAVAFSFSRDEYVPIDNEASYLLKKIPVVTEEFASGTPQMAHKVAEALKTTRLSCCAGTAALPPARPSTKPSTGHLRWKNLARWNWQPNSSTSRSSNIAG